MTADRLARHYDVLRPDERLALMLAAAARGDEVEHERLTAAAPRVSFTTLHTFPRAIAFRELLDRFRAERLDLAARYYQAKSHAMRARRGPGDGAAALAVFYGYLLLAYRDAWARFCGDHLLPSGGLDEYLMGGEVLGAAEDEAEAVGATEAEVEAVFREAAEVPSGSLRTVESVAAELAETFAVRLAWWEGEGR